MKYKTLTEFTLAVNNLAHKDCDMENNQPNNIFKAIHHDFPESMMEHYYRDGYSPRQVLNKLEQDAIAENETEARMS